MWRLQHLGVQKGPRQPSSKTRESFLRLTQSHCSCWLEREAEILALGEMMGVVLLVGLNTQTRL